MRRTDRSPQERALTLYGRVLTRTGAIYALGMAAIVPFGIVSLAFTTRYIGPTEYGRLAILYTFAAAVTVLCNLGSLPGTMMWVYGTFGDGDGGDDVVSPEDDNYVPPDTKRRIMGTGLLLTFALAAIAGALLFATAGLFDRLLLGGHGHTAEVRWAALSGVLGAPWRLVQNAFRAERRAVAFSLVSTLRPGAVVALTVAALVAGYGLVGVLAATAAGTAIAIVVSLLASHRSYALTFVWSFLPEIYRRGRRYEPVALSSFVQANADVLVLTHTSALATLGLYRVALRIGTLPSYIAHGFLMAWAPLERSPVALASKRLKGSEEFASTLFTWLTIVVLGLLVAVTLSADALIRIAAPAYAPAAGLLPYVAAAFGAQMLFLGFYRAALFNNRQFWFALLGTIGAVLYMVAGRKLVPLIGAKGLGIAGVGSSLIALGGLVIRKQRSPSPLPIQWRRLGLVVLISIGMVAVSTLPPVGGVTRAGLEVLALLLFPVLIVKLEIVPRRLLSPMLAIARSLLPDFIDRGRLLKRLHELPAHERDALVAIVGRREPVSAFAASAQIGPKLALARMTRGVRRLATEHHPSPLDHAIGSYLLATHTTVEHDDQAVFLSRQGVDLLELAEIETVFRILRGAKSRRWTEGTNAARTPMWRRHAPTPAGARPVGS